MRVGIEIGGTFTDLITLDAGGRVRFVKVPSVPRQPEQGAFVALSAADIALPAVHELVHGSTVATNAVIQRSGARVAFVTTRGFRDILLLQRQDRTRIYDLAYAKPTPIVSRADCFEVGERMLSDGSVEFPLDEAEVECDLIPRLAAGAYPAIAICLLNGYRNPVHERLLADLIQRRLQHVVVACSSDVAPEFREYERASTTAIAAHIQPVIADYLSRIEGHLAHNGFTGSFSVMQSNGGRLPSAGMRKNPITALFSGPAAGVMGAIRQAGRSGFRNLITFDMGGTSTDVCLVDGGEPELTGHTMIDGLPVRTPLLDIVSVGAGCGSIAWVDDGGMLRVGPHSAGADPGPACYGRGGRHATITDAHVIRGTIRPEAFLGGAMAIDAAAAAGAFADLARRFDTNLPDIADSAIGLAIGNIVRAIQLVSTERGRDPRDYVLVAFGGAGPLHAAKVAEDLGIETILVPPYAGVISAYGLLAADYRIYEAMTYRLVVDGTTPSAVREMFQVMKGRASERLCTLGIDIGRAVLTLTIDMRFVGQAFEVSVDLSEDGITSLTVDSLAEQFARAHYRVYRHGSTQRQGTEIVSFRLGAVVPETDVPPLVIDRMGANSDSAAYSIYEGRRSVVALAVARSSLACGQSIDGPAIVDDPTSTIHLPGGWRATCDQHDNLLLRRTPA